MLGNCFLATFRPIVCTATGRSAVASYGLAPFIDGSCRREPDFESPYPSITATCRGTLFAPRLGVGDRVAYLTVKGRYDNERIAGWRLVAVLRVLHRLPTHEAAAEWYRGRGFPLPSNCIVNDNPPLELARTNGRPPADVQRRVATAVDPERAIRLWDAGYRSRVTRSPVFLVCSAEYLELYAPVQIVEEDLRAVLGCTPGTLNPPAISCANLDDLLMRASSRRAQQ